MTATTAEPHFPTWTFGDRLRKARDVAGLSQQELAAAIGVPAGTLAGWEAGGHPRAARMTMVARAVEAATGVSAAWLLGLSHSAWSVSGSGRVA